MDIQKYIESGIIESFVMGELNDSESKEMLRLAKMYPQIQEEIDATQEALKELVFKGAEMPPVKARIGFEAFLKDQGNQNEQPALKVAKSINWSYWAAAAIALFFVSVGVNFWLFHQWKSKEEQVLALTSEQQLLVKNNKKQEAAFQNLTQKSDLLMQSNMAKVGLKGTAQMPNGAALVLWNSQNGDTYLEVSQLPKLDQGLQYQLWAIVDGKPVDAGVFDADNAGNLLKMKLIAANNNTVSAFAVTIEKQGGSASPTLEKMVLMGAI